MPSTEIFKTEVNGGFEPYLYYPQGEEVIPIAPSEPIVPQVVEASSFPASQSEEPVELLMPSDYWGDSQIEKGTMLTEKDPSLDTTFSIQESPQPTYPPPTVPTITAEQPIVVGGSISSPPVTEEIIKEVKDPTPINLVADVLDGGIDAFYNLDNNDSPLPKTSPYPGDLVSPVEAIPSNKSYEGTLYESPVAPAPVPNQEQLTPTVPVPVPTGSGGYKLQEPITCGITLFSKRPPDPYTYDPSYGYRVNTAGLILADKCSGIPALPTANNPGTFGNPVALPFQGPPPPGEIENAPDRMQEGTAAKLILLVAVFLVGIFVFSALTRKKAN